MALNCKSLIWRWVQHNIDAFRGDNFMKEGKKVYGKYLFLFETNVSIINKYALQFY